MKTYSKRLGEMKEVPDGEWVRVEVAEQLQELCEIYSRKVAMIHNGNGTMIELMLPLAPSVNTYYRYVNNRVMTSKKGRAYRKEIAAIVAAGRLKRFGDARLSIAITMHPPDRRRRDLDNVLKCLLDSLQHAGLFKDDSQIDKLSIERGERIKGGMLNVKITALEVR